MESLTREWMMNSQNLSRLLNPRNITIFVVEVTSEVTSEETLEETLEEVGETSEGDFSLG